MNLSLALKYKTIESLTYDSVFLEKPMANIIDFDYRTILSPPPKNTENKTFKDSSVSFIKSLINTIIYIIF